MTVRMSIIPNLIYLLFTRAGMYFVINKKALIFIGDRYKYVCGNMMLMEAQKFWLLIGQAKLILTNGPSFTFCTQPLLKVAAHRHKTLVKRVR